MCYYTQGVIVKIAIGDLDLLVEVNIIFFYISEIVRASTKMHDTTLKE